MAALLKLQNFGLPLLLKELIELSARRRTYIIRVAYVGLLFVLAIISLLGRLPARNASPLDQLGLGKLIFESLIIWQFAGIYVFLPALVSGALTVEKEQNTIGLLFLTRLGPWAIVFEKLLSRLVPMSCFLLSSLPLMAFSYSLGGIEGGLLVAGVWLTTVTVLQVASVTLACSAFCRTTTAALLLAYFMIAVLSFGIAVVDSIVLGDTIREWCQQIYRTLMNGGTGTLYNVDVLMFPFNAPLQFTMLIHPTGTSVFGDFTALVMGIPSLGSAIIAVILARVFVFRRAFIPPGNLVLRFLYWIDVQFQRANRNWGRGILIFDESHSIPDTSPIAWRETHKRALGQFRYLLRVFLAITIPTVLIVFLIIIRESQQSNLYRSSISSVVPILWLVTTLLISVASASLVSGERSRQTLDTMLTTPLIGRQIILEKLAGINRLIWVCSVPLAACICFEAYWRASLGHSRSGWRDPVEYWEYLAAAFSMLWIYPRLNAWLSLWVGLKCKSSTRATLVMMIVLVAFCMVPIFMTIFTFEFILHTGPGDTHGSGLMMLLQFSPLGLLLQSEFDTLREFCSIPYVPIVLNCLWYEMIWFVIRRHVLNSADRLLGRTAVSV